MATLTASSRAQLRDNLSKYFSADELDTLCVDMGEDYDVVPGRGQGELVRAREIIAYFEGRGRIEELIGLCANQRPDVDWQALLAPAPPVAATGPVNSVSEPRPHNRTGLPIGGIVLVLLLCVSAAVVVTIISNQRTPSPAANAPGATTAADSVGGAGSPTKSPPAPHATAQALATPAGALDAIVPPSTPAAPTAQPEPTATPDPPSALNVSNSVGRSRRPRMVVDGRGVLHLFWIDNTLRRAQGEDVLHRRRSPDGPWSAAQNLSNDFETVSSLELVAINDPSGHACIFLRGQLKASASNTQEPYGLYMRCLIEDVWSDPTLLAEGVSSIMVPAFAPDGSVQVLQAYAANYGPNFSGVDLTDGFGYCPAQVFHIDQENGYHVAWVQSEAPGPYSVRYRYSVDAGKTWGPEVKLSNAASVPDGLFLRSVFDRQGRLHLMWGGNNGDAFLRVWAKQTGWGDTVPVGQYGIHQIADVAIDKRDLLHTVENNAFGQLLYFQQLKGESWGVRGVGPASGSNLDGSAIALDAQDGRHIAWERDQDIFYAYIPVGQ